MTLPAMAGLALFVVTPFVLAIWLSLHFVNMQSILPPRWVGLQQYVMLFTNPAIRGQFYQALLNNAVFTIVVVPLQTGLALALAVALNQRIRGTAVLRTMFFMPVVFPMALVAVVWKLIYSPDQLGMLNSALHLVSFGHIGPIDWLGNRHTALAAIIVMSIWQGAGLQMVILLAGLQEINPALYEAAQIDGANRWQQFRNVTLPGLRNTLIFVATVTVILAFQLFDQIYILTQGGPQNSTTTVMFQAVTSAFTDGNIGQGAAITVIFFIIVLAITLIQRALLREEREVQ
jgi:multiple sugar transport system permease protein